MLIKDVVFIKPTLANRKAKNRHRTKHKKRTLKAEVKVSILCYLEKNYSPEQIVGRAKMDRVKMVSVKSIYQYIWEDKRKGGLLYRHLKTKEKKRKKRRCFKHKRCLIVGRVVIDQRPLNVEKKSRLGDLEIDLVIGKSHKGALPTIEDRASGLLFMEK